jgi:excisionase family DNA binding protein
MAKDALLVENITLEELKVIFGEIVENQLKKHLNKSPPPNPIEEIYLTRKEVCAKLNICMATLHYKTKDGILTGYRFGGKVLYKKTEIESALKEMGIKRHLIVKPSKIVKWT